MPRLSHAFILALPLLVPVCLPACATAGQVQAPQTPGPPAATQYATRVPEQEPSSDDNPLVRALSEWTRASGLERDPRLDRVAERLLAPRPFRRPQVREIEALMRAQGLVEPVPRLHAASGTEAGVVEMITAEAQQTLGRRRPTHYGLALRSGPQGAAGILLLSSRHLELAPVPRQVQQGTTLKLRGEVDPAFRNPHWFVMPPAADVQRLPPSSTRSFEVEVPMQAQGVYRVELVAVGEAGVTVLANFPVWSGQTPPPVRLGGAPESATAASVEEVQARLRELIAREREAAGLDALKRSEALDAVALDHSRDMQAHDFVGHSSPRTGSPADRVRAAGLNAWLVRENIGRGYSAEEIHEGLMQSPGHRDNILSRDAERLGLGVVKDPEGDVPAFLATELFVSLAEPVDIAEARQKVLRSIEHARRQQGLEPAPKDEGLMRTAQSTAERFFDEAVDREALLRDAMAQAPVPRGSKQVGASLTVLRALGELEDDALGLAPEAKRVGVGVAQGERGDSGPHALAVVVLYAL